MVTSTGIAKRLEVRLLREQDLAEIDSIFRLAFGTQLEHPQPEEFAPGRSCRSRLLMEPDGAFGAYLQDQLVGLSFAVTSGSVGVFGPIAVRPEFWGKGVGQLLLSRSIEFLDSRNVTDSALCTFPESPKHISLYKKFGFHPRFLIAMMSRLAPVHESSNVVPDLDLFSALSFDRKAAVLDDCRIVTNKIYDGLNVCAQIEILDRLSHGETILIRDAGRVIAFAICHFGAGSESESDVFYIKFAAVRPDGDAQIHFKALLDKCALLAQSRNLNMIFTGVNTARQEAFETMLSDGYKIDSLSVSMQKPNAVCYNHDGVYVLDDWR